MSANFNQKKEERISFKVFCNNIKKKKKNYNSLKAMLYQTHCSGGLHCLKDSSVSIFR